MQQKNSKTPLVFRVSLVLLCALVISTYMISGLYARYTSTAIATATATTAKIHINMVSGAQAFPTLDNVTVGTYFGFAAEFAVDLSQTEVTTEYELQLYIDGDAQLSYPTGKTVNKIEISSTGSGSINKNVNWANELGVGSVSGSYYIASKTEGDDSYSVVTCTENNGGIRISRKAEIGVIHYYRVIVFADVDLGTGGSLAIPNFALKYEIDCKQVN